MQTKSVRGIEINTKLVGALFTESVEDRLSVFCLYLNGESIHFELPAAGNIDSLDEMFRKLDLFEKGNSFVVEQIVRGRLYVQEPSGIYSYALLVTEGSRCPSIDENLPSLPWKCVWSGRGTEVLKLEHGKGDYCFAVRGHIVEDQLQRALHETKALVQPKMLIPPKRRSLAGVAGVATGVVLLAGGLMAYWQFGGGDAAKPTVVEARTLTPPPPPPVVPVNTTNYFLLANQERTGPFPLETILELERSGKLPADTLLRAETGIDWQKLDMFVGQGEE